MQLLGIPSQNICKSIATILLHYNLDMTPTKDTYISLTLFSTLSCFDCLRAVQCTTTQGNRERVQHSKLIDFYITMPRGAKRTFQRAWTPNRHVNCDARRISAFTGHGVNRTARILHKLFCKRAQIC